MTSITIERYQGARRQAARRGALEELLRARPALVGCTRGRSKPTHASGSTQTFRQQAAGARREHGGVQGRAATSVRPPSCSTTRTRCGRRRLKPGRYRNVTGNLATVVRARRRVAERQAADASTPRTRSRRPPTSSTSCRSYKNFGVKTLQAEDEIAAAAIAIGAAFAGRSRSPRTSRSRCRPQVGGARSRDQPRAAAGDRRRAARRAVDRPADQDRAGRPAPRDVRPPRRVADADRRGVLAEPLLRRRVRGVPHRAQVPHAGDPAHRRLPRQRRRAVAAARRRRAARHLGAVRDRSPTTTAVFWPYLRDPETLARPWAVPGHAGPDAPHRWHREGGHRPRRQGRQRQRQLRAREPRARWCASAPPRSPASRTTSPPSRSTTPMAMPTRSCSAGAARGVRSQGRCRRVRARGKPVAHVHLTHLNPFPANLGEVLARYRKVLVPEMNLGQLSRLVRAEYLVDAQSLHEGAGRAVPGRRARSQDPGDDRVMTTSSPSP